MATEDNILLRRQILDWRDKHTENIHDHLSREIYTLFNQLDKIPMSLADTFSSDSYIRAYIQPVYKRWIENKISVLLNAAQVDLNKIYQHTLDDQKDNTHFGQYDNSAGITDATKAYISKGAAIVAIPTAASLSSVSAGGLMGALGVTVISWPVALVGAAVVGSLFAFGDNKKSDAIRRHKLVPNF
jgi:hypothetical protein